MNGRSRRDVRAAAAALVTLALFGAGPVSGQQRDAVVRHVNHGYQFGFGLTLGGPYLGGWGYGGGPYLGLGGYGGGLYLGGRGSDVIVGVGGHGGIPYSYAVPDGYDRGGAATYGATGYPYYGTSVSPVPPVVTPGYPLQPLAPLAVVPGAVHAGDSLVIETVNDGILRLTWRESASSVREVTLFLADETRKVLAQQTVRTAPFTALFDLAPGTAHVGVTLRYPDGVESTIVMPAPRR